MSWRNDGQSERPRPSRSVNPADRSAWAADAGQRMPDFTASILSRVDQAKPFLPPRGRLAAQLGRSLAAAAALAALLAVVAIQNSYPVLTDRGQDRPVSTLVAGVSDQADRVTNTWWPRPQSQPTAAALAVRSEPRGDSPNIVRTVLAAWPMPMSDRATFSSVSSPLRLPEVNLRPAALVERAGHWVWRERRPAQQAATTRSVGVADQVSSAVRGQCAPLLNPD